MGSTEPKPRRFMRAYAGTARPAAQKARTARQTRVNPGRASTSHPTKNIGTTSAMSRRARMAKDEMSPSLAARRSVTGDARESSRKSQRRRGTSTAVSMPDDRMPSVATH